MHFRAGVALHCICSHPDGRTLGVPSQVPFVQVCAVQPAGHHLPSSAPSARSASDAASDWAAWKGPAATEGHPAPPPHHQQQPAWHQAQHLNWPAEPLWQQGQLSATQAPTPTADPFAESAFNQQLARAGAGAGRPAAGGDPFAGSPTIMLGVPGAARPTVGPAATQQRWQLSASLPQPQTGSVGAVPGPDVQKQPLQARWEAGFTEAQLGDPSGAGQASTPQPQAGFAGAWAGSSVVANGAHADDEEDDFGDFAEAVSQAAAPQQHAGSQHKEAGPRYRLVATLYCATDLALPHPICSITTLYVDTVVSQAACLAQSFQQRVCCWVQSSLVGILAAWVSKVACPSLQGTANDLTGGSSSCQCFCRQGPIALSIFGEEDLEDPEMPGLQVGPVWAPPWGPPVKPGQGGQQDAAPSSGLGVAGALPVGVAGRWQHAPGGSLVAESGQVGMHSVDMAWVWRLLMAHASLVAGCTLQHSLSLLTLRSGWL